MNAIKSLLCLTLGISSVFTAGETLARVNVAASFSITEDIVREIGKDRVTVTSVIPRGSNPHSYDLRPQDLITLEKADIVFLTGLGFDDFLKRWSDTAKNRNKIIDISQGIKPLRSTDADDDGEKETVGHHHHEEDHDHEHHHDHEEHRHGGHHHHHHGGTDPHAWQNPLNGAIYAENIRKELCGKEPDSCAFFTENAAIYVKTLKDLDARYQERFSGIPEHNRIMITTHDAFNYLADHYRIQILAPRGITDSHEPSAGDIARIEELMKENKVRAVFIENLSNNTAVEELSRKNGDGINGILYTDSLTSEPEGNTYLKLIEHNLNAIWSAMSE